MGFAIPYLPELFPAKRRPTGLWSSVTIREPESPAFTNGLPELMIIWSTNLATPESYPMFMTAFIPTIVPFVNFVVRPYFCTESPTASVTAADFGAPYPPDGVEFPRRLAEERAIAASILFEASVEKTIGSKSASVPIMLAALYAQPVS